MLVWRICRKLTKIFCFLQTWNKRCRSKKCHYRLKTTRINGFFCRLLWPLQYAHLNINFVVFHRKKRTFCLATILVARLRFFLPNDRIIHNLCENSMQVTQNFVETESSSGKGEKFNKTECVRIVLKQKNASIELKFSVLQQIIKSECNCSAIVWRGECLSTKVWEKRW